MDKTLASTRKKGRPAGAKNERRREKILQTGLALFARQGVSDTSLAQIAGEAGLTSAMVHYYFRNRDGLLDALVDEIIGPRIEKIHENISHEDMKDPQKIMRILADELLKMVGEMPGLPALWNREIFYANGVLRKRLMPYLNSAKFREIICALRLAQKKGLLRQNILPELLLVSMVSLIMVPLAAKNVFSDFPDFPRVDDKKAGEHGLAIMLGGMGGEMPEKGKV